ncbi:MAG: hypothetical protein EOP04_15430 [Proteobacteria bacterium]|nr:MAG: hypothetical protein EOP04_15430 [Pseudomonadota bacterium]
MTRSTFLNLLIGIAGLGFFGLGDIQKLQKIYLLQCFVAGFRFHRVWSIYTHMYNVDSIGWMQDKGGKSWLEFGWWKE